MVDPNGRVLGMPTLGEILNLLVPGGGGRPIGDRTRPHVAGSHAACLNGRVAWGEAQRGGIGDDGGGVSIETNARA